MLTPSIKELSTMKLSFKKIAVAFSSLALVVSSTALAQKKSKTSTDWTSPTYSTLGSTYIHEVDLNLSMGQLYNYKHGDNSYSDLTAIGSYNRVIQDQIQVGALAGFSNTYRDRSNDNTMLFTLMGTGTYNFDSNLDESIFATGGIGLAPAYEEDDREFVSAMSFFVGAGKRFKLYEHVHYKPQLRIEKLGSMDTAIRLLFLNVSLMF
jgi:hypothetical protein